MDSTETALLIEAYVNQWIEQKLKEHQAQESLNPDRLEDIENRMQDYKVTLLVHEYEKQLLKDLVDTGIYEEEIIKAYETNEENFRLKSDIYQVYYLKVPKSAPDLKNVKKWMRDISPNYIDELQNYATRYAKEHLVDDNRWLKKDELDALVPESLNETKWYKGRFREAEEGNYVHFIKINDLKIEQTTAPLEFVRDDVVNIILRKRAQDIIDKAHSDLMIRARKKKEFEKYNIKE